jgi:hypothetical protein
MVQAPQSNWHGCDTVQSQYATVHGNSNRQLPTAQPIQSVVLEADPI